MPRKLRDTLLAAVPLALGCTSQATTDRVGYTASMPVNHLACTLNARLAEKEPGGNRLFSPYALSTAQAMAAEGARGQTRQEMAAAMGLPPGSEQDLQSFHRGLASLAEVLAPRPVPAQTQARLEKLKAELADANRRLESDRRYSEQSRTLHQQADAWAREINQLQQQIEQYEFRSANSLLIVVNAVYFLGQWAEPFHARHTNDATLTTPDGQSVTLPLMHGWNLQGAGYGAFNFDGSPFKTPVRVSARGDAPLDQLYPRDGFQVLGLPNKGGGLSMLVLTPRTAAGLVRPEAMLSGPKLGNWTRELVQRDVEVFLTCFKLQTSYSLAAPLRELGMKRAFVNPARPGGAEFDGISPSSDPRQRLYISAIVQKAFVELNEKGTEAASATAIAMAAGTAVPTDVPFKPVFRADRPFVFVIQEDSTGTVLFMGRVVNPAG